MPYLVPHAINHTNESTDTMSHTMSCRQLSHTQNFMSDRLTHRGGGTAIIIKKSIAHHSIDLHTNALQNSTKLIEGSQKLIIYSVYRPPRSAPQTLISDLLKLLRNRTHCFIVGDFNAKHHTWSPHSKNNPSGVQLAKFVRSYGFLISYSSEPNMVPNRANQRPATVDFGLSCGLDNILVETHVELSSDHNPVQFIIPLISDKPYAQNYTTFINWNLFPEILTNTVPGYRVVQKTLANLSLPPVKQELNRLQGQIKRDLVILKRREWDNIGAQNNVDELHKILRKKRKTQVKPSKVTEDWSTIRRKSLDGHTGGVIQRKRGPLRR
ncbi:putative RNA-directed DNA polymerase from transposon X-element [Trichonephila clavipes]|nr:putative RNA-directed DNA polymerase from transposon X-element [Trichonephila clavipes]